jgi:hypothetical protein
MTKMMKEVKIKKIMIALLMVSATHIAMGSFTGTTNKKSDNLYSLKNFNRNFSRNNSPFSLRAGFEYKGARLISQKKEANGDISVNSIMRFEKGNTTYIYPYTHKISVPKFKAPTASALR